ncbi:MAG: hypothetical protein E6R04_11940 [Spirochaetes bacterium]|nr:MAG: hypothetical protein E6R04_11940 [Spirochaetota bacterium]
MIYKSLLLSEEKALKAYHNKQFRVSLETLSWRILMISVYYYRIDLFAWDICKRWTSNKKTGQRFRSPPFHLELWEAAKSPEDMLAIIQRDGGKTTAISKILVLWFLIYGLEPSILLLSSKGLGEEIIGDLRTELENNSTLRAIYGSLVPSDDRKNFKGKKWRQRELQLINGTEIKSLSKGEPIRGRRPTKIIVDDPQENKDIKNPIIADEFYNWFWTSVYPIISEGNGSMAVLGTVIGANCFVNMLKAEAEEKGIKLIEYTAIKDFDKKRDIEILPNGDVKLKGVPLWPERWSIEKLERRAKKMKKKGKLDAFLQEYFNIAYITNGSPVFTDQGGLTLVNSISESNNIKYYRPITETFKNQNGKMETRKVDAILGIDIADGGENGDYSTIIVRNIKGEKLAQYRGHCSQMELARLTDILVEQFDRVLIVPESNHGLAFLNEARKYSWFRRIYQEEYFDKATKKKTQKLGFNTNSRTKPILIDLLRKWYASESYEVSEELQSEIENYYHNETGGMEAISPHHDDLVIADGLCAIGIEKGLPGDLVTII